MKQLILLLVGVGLMAGCGKPVASVPLAAPAAPELTNAPAQPAADSVAEGPKPGEKICFACNGQGTIKCLAPGCVAGLVDCPGPCLKLDRGVWVHLEVPGHPPSDLWQKFYLPDGSYQAYNQNHVGHVIVLQNGQAVDTGACKICGGTGKVPCALCQGTGREKCLICDGKKFIPSTWTPTDNLWLNRQPDLLRLADGRVLFGKLVSTVGSEVTIKTRDGKWLHIKASELMTTPAVAATNEVLQ
jgi:hypothetical protein